MKPSNLSGRMMVLNPAATRDEDSIYAHVESSMCAFFDFIECRERNLNQWKKDCLPLNV